MDVQMIWAGDLPVKDAGPRAVGMDPDWASVLDCGALGPWALGPNAPGRGGDEPALFYQRGRDLAGGQDA